MRANTPRVAPWTIPPSEVVIHGLPISSSLTLIFGDICFVPCNVKFVCTFTTLFESFHRLSNCDGKVIWFTAIMVIEIAINRANKLAMLFWFIRRKYLWYKTSACTLRNLCERKTRLHNVNMFHHEPFECSSMIDSTSSCSPSLDSPVVCPAITDELCPFPVLSIVNLYPSPLAVTLKQ